MLALASPDADRFTRDMGILYLARLGELASGALAAPPGGLNLPAGSCRQPQRSTRPSSTAFSPISRTSGA